MLRLALAVVTLAAALFVGARRVGPVPALGSFLDPAHGVWSLARSATLSRDAEAGVPHLGADVAVLYDDRAVPHIFATTEDDAYRALGYVTARDRLFQLYLQTMAASGRLTELAGPRALELDREMRGLGLPRSAERLAASAADTSVSVRHMRAYADGINAYVRQMPASELPLEFRLTGTRPFEWTLADSYHLFNRMGWTLAYLALEDDRAAAASRVGMRAAEALFPDDLPIQEPIQPNGQRAARLDFRPLPPPGAPDGGSARLLAAADVFFPAHAGDRNAGDEPRAMASNNWAVAPGRSATGHALLAGDPHLDLTLPSIWYEAHLVVPGTLDVYGVTIPGSGAIVIGFNRDVAWTFTNTSVDVLDLYAEEVDDAAHPTRYRLDGAWKPLEQRVELYRGTHGEHIATDTLYFTHRGPMRRVGPRWLSMRWTVLEAGTELNGFHAAAHARSATELEDGFSKKWYRAPAQNMLAADRGGHIAIRSSGRFPIRPGDGRGSVVRDGTTSASDWTGALPVSQYPQSLDPAQGFLASANQQPIDPRVATGWWGGSYDPWRAMRINALLRSDSTVTVDAMRRYQTDPGSARADLFVPRFLDAAQRVLARATMDTQAARLSEAAGLLGQWDRRYTRDNRRAVLFEGAMQELVTRTWDELATPGSTRRVITPSGAVLAELLADSGSVWWDDRSTPAVEHRDDILAASLVASLEGVRKKYGDPNGDGWRWDRIRHANVNHLLRIPALSALDIPVQGGPGTLSPSSGSGTHSASWRMVVELGPELRAWATYPGGQSGNPVSPRYRDRIPLWAKGELEPVRLPTSPAQLDSTHRSATLTLRPVP